MKTVRSSLASLNKVMPKASPAKPTGEEAKTGATRASVGGIQRTTTMGASRLTRPGVQSAKQQELAAKKEEMEK